VDFAGVDREGDAAKDLPIAGRSAEVVYLDHVPKLRVGSWELGVGRGFSQAPGPKP
jgi:hypothetical protein